MGVYLSFAFGCRKSETKEHELSEPATHTAPIPTSAEPAKSEYKPDEIWKATDGVSRMDIMEKFKDGVTVTGTIIKVDEPAGGEYAVSLDAKSGHTVVLTFSDFGATAKAKGLKAGDAVTATKCQIVNPTADRLPLVLCTLK